MAGGEKGRATAVTDAESRLMDRVETLCAEIGNGLKIVKIGLEGIISIIDDGPCVNADDVDPFCWLVNELQEKFAALCEAEEALGTKKGRIVAPSDSAPIAEQGA